MNEIKIPLDSKKSVKFFSKYHNADLYLNMKGFFEVEITNPSMRKISDIIITDLTSALQAALTLISEKGNIYHMLADPVTFDMINQYIKICLEDTEDISFSKIVLHKIAFDKESISVIKISEQLKNTPVQTEIPVRCNTPAASWKCSNCGCINPSKFCMDCGNPRPEKWKCICGAENDSSFCTECGTQKNSIWKCNCGSMNKGNFCPLCGNSKHI